MRRRSYNQYCGIARSLDVIGERWTLLIVRDLLLGPLRYSELLRGLPGITTNLLAKRLAEMEGAGLVERAGEGAVRAYRLTGRGAALEPALQALARWGWGGMRAPARGEHRELAWLLVALRGTYRGGRTLRAELRVDGAPYRITLRRDGAEIARGDMPAPDVRVVGNALAMARLFRNPPARGEEPPGLEVTGPADALRTLATAFGTDALTFSLS